MSEFENKVLEENSKKSENKSESENKDPQEESSGFLLIKMILAFAVCGYGIYIMFK